MSVVPIIYELEKNKKIKTILVTTSTLSSSKIFQNFKFKKTIHQFFPIDQLYFTSKFINYWKPKISIFIDSEIWPCMYKELTKKNIPLFLLNARITPKSFRRWNFFNKLSKNIFENIKIAYPANTETKRFLKRLNVKKIIDIGNIKFCEVKTKKGSNFSNSFLLKIKKRIIFVHLVLIKERKILLQNHI